MNVLDLFSGIGGFSLGLERAGMRTVAFCEIEPYCRAVLRKHWPDVPIHEDVRSLRGEDVGTVDVICGGFPCQDISLAGKGAGLAGERSGLWSEFRRLIEELRPRYAIIENVAALRSRGLDAVLGSLAAIGYDAEWHCIPACAIGAPHRRDRVWIIAYAQQQQLRQQPGRRSGEGGAGAPQLAEHGEARSVAHATRDVRTERASSWAERKRAGAGGEPVNVADAEIIGRPDRDAGEIQRTAKCERPAIKSERCGGPLADPYLTRLEVREQGNAGEQPTAVGGGWWESEPDVGRVAHGVPSRVDRLRALGNAVVPQIPELIGRAILSAESLS